MHTRASAASGWEEDDDDDFEAECVATVEDGFERGAALHGLWIHVQSQELRSGSVTAVLAGLTLDLREAALSPEGATIHVQAALSGIRILVPPSWAITWDVDAIWSGVSESRGVPQQQEPGPRLRIAGTVVAGGLSVR